MQWDIKQPLIFLTLSAVGSVGLMIVSSLTFSFIEKPGMRAGRNVTQWVRKRIAFKSPAPLKDEA